MRTVTLATFSADAVSYDEESANKFLFAHPADGNLRYHLFIVTFLSSRLVQVQYLLYVQLFQQIKIELSFACLGVYRLLQTEGQINDGWSETGL